MTKMRGETPGEAPTEMPRKARTTETMTGPHADGTTLRSHVSAVTSPQTENHLENDIHALETPLQTPGIDLLGASQPVIMIVIVTVTPLIDLAVPQLLQAMMREIDVEPMTGAVKMNDAVKMTDAVRMNDAVKMTDPVMKTDALTKIEVVTKIETKTEATTKTDAVAGAQTPKVQATEQKLPFGRTLRFKL